jgi:uncharacterized protein YbaP (TraB family)
VVHSAVRLFRSCLIVGLAFFSACDRAVSQNEDTGTPAGSIWVVDKPGSPGQLYLCGTIHILRKEDYPLAPGYEDAYQKSGKLVFELPPGSEDSQQLTLKMQELGSYPEGKTIETELGPDLWAEVKKWAAKRGASTAVLAKFRPWFLALVITSTEYAALGAKPDKGVDQHFEERAKRDGKPGIGLETAEFQIKLFTELSAEQQRNLLEQTLAEVHTLPQEYEKMISAWKQGDIESLQEMLFREAERYPELLDLFLNDRNRAWIAPLVEMLKKGETVMVLVGTGHMAGDAGLIKLLEQRGYRVRRYAEAQGN